MPYLKYVTPLFPVSNSVAIVGSAGKLKNSDHGALIDSFDTVVRFNRAPTNTFEADVGYKTTLRVSNNHVFKNHREDPKVWPDQPQYFIKNLRNTKILYFASDAIPWQNRDKNTHESVETFLFDYSKVGVLRKPLNLKKQITVGLGFVALCVETGIVPHLFGFSTSPGDLRDHYWEPRPEAGPYHDVSAESLSLLSLSDQGKIILH